MRLLYLSLMAIALLQEASALDFVEDIRPIMDRYCLECHDTDTQKGGLDLELLTVERDLYTYHELTEAVIYHVGELRDMPPEKQKDQPTDKERATLVDFLDDRLTHPDPEVIDNPGFLPVHRLSNRQYRNTIRDLIGVGMEVVDGFPQDNAVEGYDHVASGLEFSSMHLERYLAAAHYLMDRVFVPASVEPLVIEAEDQVYSATFGLADWEKNATLPAGWPESEIREGVLRIYQSGGFSIPLEVDQSGYFEVKARLKTQHIDGKVGGRVHVFVDGKKEGSITHLSNRAREWVELGTKLIVSRGKKDLRIAWEGMNTEVENPTPNDLNFLEIDRVTITGPISENPAMHEQIRKQLVRFYPNETLSPEEAARKTIAAFASRAFRRPVAKAEVEELVAFAGLRDRSYEAAVRRAFTAVLASPKFLMHREKTRDAVESHRLGSFEIANRLSYFLWSSMPDAELMAMAGQDRLSDPEVLEVQVERMLADEKAQDFAESFAPQWLQLGSLFLVDRSGKEFPKFVRQRQGIREAMRDEVISVFHEVTTGNRSILELIDADFTYVNRETAEQYGIEGIDSRELQRVELVGDLAAQRGGLLTMSAVLMSVSHPSDTNPSGRGRWILDALLGTPPPPPPPDVEPLPKPDKDTSKMTLRERLAIHRDDVNCASCHERIDPFGFALENYDQNGTWRSEESGRVVETAAVLYDGTSVDGPDELKRYLLEEKRDLYVENFARQVLTYALRRGLAFHDTPTVQECVSALEENDYRFRDLVVAIVKSYPFQYRRSPFDER